MNTSDTNETKYCCEDFRDAIEGNYIGPAISFEGIYVTDSCGVIYPEPIYYCPWCGRNLQNWQELVDNVAKFVESELKAGRDII